MSAKATTRAPPVSKRLVASSVPRPPHPSSPTRTCEFASEPQTPPAGINMTPPTAAAVPRNFLRPISFFSVLSFAISLPLMVKSPEILIPTLLQKNRPINQFHSPGSFSAELGADTHSALKASSHWDHGPLSYAPINLS